MKKYLVLAMMALGSMSILAYDFEVDGIYYNIVSASNLTVVVTYQKTYSGTYYTTSNTPVQLYDAHLCTYTGNIVIPSFVIYNGKKYTVVAIGAYAFCSDVTSLGNHDSNLKSIVIPESVLSIGEYAFYNCKGLNSVILPNSLDTIDEYAFSRSGFNSHILPNLLSYIGTKAFEGCQFEKVIIPSVNYIGHSAFPNTLRTLIMLQNNPPIINGSISSNTRLIKVMVPSIEKYSQGVGWKDCNLVEILTPNSHEFEYRGQKPIIEWTNNLSGYSMNVSNGTLQKDAGTHSTDVKADFYKDDELDFSVEFPYEYTINKAKLNTKINNASREYGEDNPSFSVAYSGFVNNEDESVIITEPTLSTTATKTSNVGTYPITASGGEATNYDFVCEPGVLTVTKAPLSAMVNDATKVYGVNNPSFTINYYGLKNEETVPAWTTSPTFQTEATKQSGVGQYTVNAINGVPRNYDLGKITSGTLTITPAPLIIKANNASRLYYNDNPALTYTCSGFKNSDNETILSPVPTLSTTATQSSNVGTYEIKAEGASSPNYSISYTNGTLTITPRKLTASVGNYERTYNEENPEFEILYYCCPLKVEKP